MARTSFEGPLSWLDGAGAGALDHVVFEEELGTRGRDRLRQMFQGHLDLRALREERIEGVACAEGVCHGAVEGGHVRPLSTIFGPVRVTRLAYRRASTCNAAAVQVRTRCPWVPQRGPHRPPLCWPEMRSDRSEAPDVEGVERRARAVAAAWRGAGIGRSLDTPVRPPASSALLASNLEAYRHEPLYPPATSLVVRALRRLRRRLTADLGLRVARLERYEDVSTDEIARTLARLDVEAAELRARVGRLEEDAARTPAP